MQRNISTVLKGRPRWEADDIIPGIILGNEEDIDSILLDWTTFLKELQPARTMERMSNSAPSA